MPFDPLPASPPIVRRPELQPVAFWLFGLCAMVLVMVSLGGATRLTGSGLSIMEWAPLMGTLPPMSDAEWHRLYALYQQIPQYSLINHDLGIAGFKGIFWLEWVHRLWGRLMGVALFIPLVWFIARGRIQRGLATRLFGLLVLGGLQGAVGWFMVASGFEADSTAVSPYRLVMHLGLAVSLYAALLWTALGVRRQAAGPSLGYAPRFVRRLTIISAVLVVITILAGGFVAGLHAGLVYNSFPLMDGHLFPEGYAILHPFARNLFENIPAVQFDHRLLATATATISLLAAVMGVWSARGQVRTAMAVLGVAVLIQYALGVTTLLWSVPVSLGTAHQAMAMLVLTAALVALHLQSRGRQPRAVPGRT
jgi:cytochrome c oxidase assembly protein subunit 15